MVFLLSVKLRPRLETIDANDRFYSLLTIMTNDTEEHIAKVVEDEQYWQDIRNFFLGGPPDMAVKPMWFLFGMKKLPKDFDPWSGSVEYIKYFVGKQAVGRMYTKMQAPAQDQEKSPAPDSEREHRVAKMLVNTLESL